MHRVALCVACMVLRCTLNVLQVVILFFSCEVKVVLSFVVVWCGVVCSTVLVLC